MKEQTEPTSGPPMGVTPILVVNDAVAAAAFYKKAFNAQELARIPAPDGKRLLHLRLHIFGTTLVIMDEFPELAGPGSGFSPPQKLQGTTVSLHTQVNDAQFAWDTAIQAGATPIIPLAMQFWGELYGRLKDPFGHEWTVAQMVNHLSDEDVERSANDVF